MKPVKLSDAIRWWRRIEAIHDAAPPTLEMMRMPWGFTPHVLLHKSVWQKCTFPGCERPAGISTNHPGLGPCARHAGNTIKGITEGWMIMATGYARMRAGVSKITPAEALIEILQITRNDAAWLGEKVSTAPADEELVGDGSMVDFVALRERALDRYYRVAVSAHTAKAVDMLNEQEQAMAEVMTTILLPAIERLELDADLRHRVLSAIDGQLVELDSKAASATETPHVDNQQVINI